MKSVHFIMVYNAANLDNAKELAKRELERFGLNKLGIVDWYQIASVYKDDGSEFITESFEQMFYNLKEANDLVNQKWLQGIYSDEITALIKRVNENVHDKFEISELSSILRGYGNLLETNRVRKTLCGQQFNIRDGHEFNPGIYTEFGVSYIVNSFAGDTDYIVTVYQK